MKDKGMCGHRTMLRLLFAAGAVGAAAVVASRKKQVAAPEPAGSPEDRVTVSDPEAFKELGKLFRAIIISALKDPAKAKILNNLELLFAIDPTGCPEQAFTARFARGLVSFENSVAPDADIVIKTPFHVLFKLTVMAPTAPPEAIRFFLGTPAGKDVLGRFRSGEFRVHGKPTKLPKMMKLMEALAV